ncbi:MAG: hypothetical protein H8D23_17625 [Candidatus Brocadiales bacterium]|nr:hypothetical protein [Candidatus Brocadiales bacterium]
MKLLTLNDAVYRILHTCAPENVEAAKTNRQYDTLVKNDKQNLFYFLEIIPEAEFRETSMKLLG